MKKLSAILLAIVVCIIIGTTTIMHAQAATFNKGIITKGIYIDGMDVSGMTAKAVKQTVQDKIDVWAEAELTLTSPTGYEIKVHPSDLGMSWINEGITNEAAGYANTGNVWQRYKAKKDIELDNIQYDIELSFNKSSIQALLDENADMINQEPANYELEKTDNGIEVKKGQAGIKIDSQAADKIYEYLMTEWNKDDAQIEIPSVVDDPMAGNGDISSLPDIIGTFTTNYKSSGKARVQNVVNGCKLIDGAILNPGESFSVLEHLVPFNAENGYALAGSYMSGLVVDTYGGGICQVSSTLYNAVLLAELQVDTRQNHSMIVDYVPASGDAAITESSGKDFVFTNNKSFPIYIEGYTTEDKNITFNIYGIEDRPANRVVSFKSEVLERTVAETENIIPDAGKPIGYTSVTSSHAGIKAQYIKVVTVDGVEESSEVINKSNYKMVPRTLVVGVATDNADAYNQIQAAIATGSIDHTRAVAGALAAQSAVPAQELQAPQVGEP